MRKLTVTKREVLRLVKRAEREATAANRDPLRQSEPPTKYAWSDAEEALNVYQKETGKRLR